MQFSLLLRKKGVEKLMNYTVKQMADSFGVSKNSIRNLITKRGMTPISVDSKLKTKFYDQSTFDTLRNYYELKIEKTPNLVMVLESIDQRLAHLESMLESKTKKPTKPELKKAQATPTKKPKVTTDEPIKHEHEIDLEKLQEQIDILMGSDLYGALMQLKNYLKAREDAQTIYDWLPDPTKLDLDSLSVHHRLIIERGLVRRFLISYEKTFHAEGDNFNALNGLKNETESRRKTHIRNMTNWANRADEMLKNNDEK